jgi:hypothetical protein
VFAGLSIAVFLSGLFVTTTREVVADLTSEFLRRVIASDAEWAEPRIADRLIVASAGEIYDGFGKTELVAAIRGFSAFGAQDWSEKRRGATVDAEGLARTQSTVHIRAAYIQSQMIPSTWEFTWSRAADGGWQLTRLECLTMWGQPPRIHWERDARNLGRFQPGRPSAGGLRPERH